MPLPKNYGSYILADIFKKLKDYGQREYLKTEPLPKLPKDLFQLIGEEAYLKNGPLSVLTEGFFQPIVKDLLNETPEAVGAIFNEMVKEDILFSPPFIKILLSLINEDIDGAESSKISTEWFNAVLDMDERKQNFVH